MSSDLFSMIDAASKRSAQSLIESKATARIKKLPWIRADEVLPKNDFSLPFKDRKNFLVKTQPHDRLYVATFGHEGRDYWIDTSGLLLTPAYGRKVVQWCPLPRYNPEEDNLKATSNKESKY